MKRIIMLFSIFFIGHKIYSQASVTINCAFGQSCFLTDPNVLNNYVFNLNLDTLTTQNGWDQGSPTWTLPNGGGTVTGGANSPNYAVTWANLTNTVQKKVKVVVPFTQGRKWFDFELCPKSNHPFRPFARAERA